MQCRMDLQRAGKNRGECLCPLPGMLWVAPRKGRPDQIIRLPEGCVQDQPQEDNQGVADPEKSGIGQAVAGIE